MRLENFSVIKKLSDEEKAKSQDPQYLKIKLAIII